MPPIIEELKNKRIAILGFGKEGQSTYHYIRKYLPNQELTIADLHPIDTNRLTNVKTIIGEHYQELDAYDIVMKSPGIVLTHRLPENKLNSQTNLFLKHYGKQTIGITGTKGKSTTASLLYHTVSKHKPCVLLGNIGKPAFDQLEDIQADTIVVYELSCHQLEYTHYAPHFGVLLNLYEEHLDHYGTYERYVHAKENIWRYQDKQDMIVLEHSLQNDDIYSQIISASMEHEDADIFIEDQTLHIENESITIDDQATTLLGKHNRYDIAIVFYLAKQLGISYTDSLAALKSFAPLSHRLEYVGYLHDLHWYDDSISTICETTIQALKSLPKTDTLLLGGMDRGIDYTPLSDYLNAHPIHHVILMYDSGSVLSKLLHIPYTVVKDLAEAVETAKQVSQKGSVVLLSPAAASYGFFKNFEERGDHYQMYIKNEA